MAETKRRPGRPGREPELGERVGLSLRVTPGTKRALDAASEAAGRSLSQEAEMRLERSFRDESLIPQLLDAAYGRQTAGLLMLLARVIRDTAHTSAFMRELSLESAEDWMRHPWAYRQVEEAVHLVFDALRPAGEAKLPEVLEGATGDLLNAFTQYGRGVASAVLRAAAGHSVSGRLEEAMAPVRERLGDILEPEPAE